jgi:hypothetical protein
MIRHLAITIDAGDKTCGDCAWLRRVSFWHCALFNKDVESDNVRPCRRALRCQACLDAERGIR